MIRKLLSMALILNLYLGGIPIPRLSSGAEARDHFEGFTCMKNGEAVSAEVSSADGFDGSDCKYKYNYADGDGEEIKDGTDIAFQQIALFLSIYNGVTRLSRCIVAAASGCRCQGWSTGLISGAMVTVLIGEIVEMVKYEDITETLKKEYDLAKVSTYRDICAEGDKPAGMSEEEKTNYCDGQIAPLKKLRDALKAQSEATYVKFWLYIVATAMVLAGTTLEIIAAAKMKAMFAAHMANLLGLSVSCKAEATANPAAASCAVAATQQLIEDKKLKIACEAAEKGTPNSVIFDSSCKKPQLASKSLSVKKIKVACAACGSGKPQELFVTTSKIAEVARMTDLTTPGDYTCDVYTQPVASSKGDINSVLDRIVKAVTLKQAMAEPNDGTGRQVDHEIRFWTSIVGSLGGLGIALGVYFGTWKSQDYFNKGPILRAVLNGINFGFLTTNIFFAMAVVEKLDEEVERLNSMIRNVEIDLSGVDTGLDSSGERITIDNQSSPSFEDQFAKEFKDVFGDNPSPCAFGEADGKGKGGCKNLDASNAKTMGALNLKGLAQESTQLGNDFAGEISGRTEAGKNITALGNKLAAKRGPIKRMLDSLLKKYNSDLRKAGEKPFNFDKEVANGIARVKTAVRDSLAKSGKSLASLSAPGVVPGKIGEGKKETKKDTPKKVAVEKDLVAGVDDGGFSFNYQEQNPNAPSIDTDQSLLDEASKYEVDTGDINNNKSTNIFRVITTRYFKSAYPVLVEETKD